MRATKETSDPPIPSPREFAEWFHAPPLVVEAREPETWVRHRLCRLDALLAVALLLGAIAARMPLIERGETLLHSDEAIVGIMAQDISEGRALPIFFYGQRYMGALEAYVIAAISFVVPDPITALRLGPTLFFAALVVVQFLMLSRWFGRRGGLVGAAALLACAPMFAQWSISARGGYIEILLWGSALLWAYSEWFIPSAQGFHPTSHSRSPFRRFDVSTFLRFAFGLLIGSGLWINPSIILFVVPVVIHFLLNGPLGRLRATIDGRLPRTIRTIASSPMALPSLFIMGVIAFNCTWYVYVEGARVHSEFLLGLLPRGAALAIIAVTALSLIALANRRLGIIALARRSMSIGAPLILGTLVGAAPAVLYVTRAVLGLSEMDPSLPLGLRPIWKIESTLNYFVHGMPLLFGADARPFLDVVTTGRPGVFRPLDIMTSGMLSAANRLVLGGAMTAAIVLWMTYRDEIGRLSRLKTGVFSPAILLVIGTVVTTALYLLSGAAHDFNTIRYLIPLWAFVPGLLAASTTGKHLQKQSIAACTALCAAWSFGQFTMHEQLGNPHPLRPLADELVARKTQHAVAEIFDAHLLSYMTGQACRIAEFDPFWSRLSHYQGLFTKDSQTSYITPTVELTHNNNGWAYPGPPPPELSHPLLTRLSKACRSSPAIVVSREPLAAGYELVITQNPLPTRNASP